MTLFDNLKNKLFKEETSGKGKESQPAGKSKDLQDRIKGLFAKKPDEVEQAVEELDMSRESQETSRYQRSKQKKPIDTTKPLGKVRAFLSKFTLSPRNPIRRFWRRYHIGKILFILVAVLVLTVGSYLFYIAKTTNVSDLQDALKATTVIYDKEGNQAGSLSGQKGTYVELDAISDSLENAVIATEDRTFYKNSGINVKRFLLAIVSMGRFGGGSTITQQLAKNAFLTQEQTVTRKAKEFFLSLELTKKYSKQEILTMYLNNAYFGNGVWGVEDASQKYFGTSAANLTVDEAASIRNYLIRQLITMAIPQPTMVVLRLMMCPCIKLWPTLTIFRQFISLTKSVYKKGLVTVRNLVLTLIMFQKN